MKEEQLKQAFEAVFGISYETGREDVRYLIQKAQRMGNFAEGHKINWGGRTTLNDRDFLKVAFFAIIGAGFVEEILGTTPELPDGKTRDDTTRERIEQTGVRPKPYIPCGHCENDPPDAPPCLACDGRGYFEAKPHPPEPPVEPDDACPKCAGDGSSWRNHGKPIGPCPVCGGSGRVARKSVEVDVTPKRATAAPHDDGSDLGLIDGPEKYPDGDESDWPGDYAEQRERAAPFARAPGDVADPRTYGLEPYQSLEDADPRTYELEPYQSLEVRHRGGPDDFEDVAMSNDPRRPKILMRCGSCCKDMGQVNGVDWACINPMCHEYHQAIEIDLG
jgi:hypothetical protein